ncbi:DUF2147 domain-containing protein [Spirosoma agri]|uniref:DUF2147 domain-containing protein n=1 Tax=Spirosoma agri TaxID=1987381 RepID=A0A6M0ICP8_9BACT|nr:DUF2147 domain-containing protein [Spirosoma agri]NEU66046.1 DUF2147 domain-containing protein [Spirosoma agri]
MSLLLFRNYLWASLFLVLSLWPVPGKSSVDRTADQILGRWLFPGRGSTVELYRVGDRYFGRISDVSPTGKEQFGLTKNQLLISNLAFDGKGWSGELIHPKTGNHLNIDVEMVDSRTINATVYKGWRWLNKEFVMTREAL